MSMTLLPPKPGTCPLCATNHHCSEPHNQRSLYYQMRFRLQHGRWPTWGDALAHCDDRMRAMWLRERGVEVGSTDPADAIAEPGGASTCD